MNNRIEGEVMMIQRLKCIEELLTIIHRADSKSFDAINNNELFQQLRLNLFTETIINSLIKNFHNKTSFSIKKLFAHKIEISKGTYIDSPNVDIKYIDNKELFLEKIIEALKNNEYSLDDDNIIICNDDINVSISQSWLYIVACKYAQDHKEKLFLYNKWNDKRIVNKEQLISFIKQSKTFICKQVDMTDQEFANNYNNAQKLTKRLLIEHRSDTMPLDKIISYFSSFMSRKTEYAIEKYRIPSPVYIVKKAQSYKGFYLLPYEKQEKIIIDWILEYKHNNNKCNTLIEQLLISPYKVENVPKNDLITGLLNLYLSLISKLEIDFDNVSLTGIKLISYIDDKVIDHSVKQRELIKKINGLENSSYKKDIKTELERIYTEIGKSGQEDIDKLNDKQKELALIAKKYKENEENIREYRNKLSSETNIINSINYDGITELAFDYNRIMKCIQSAAVNGVIIENPLDSKVLIIEEQSPELGKNKFLAKIDINELLLLISTINYYLEERTPSIAQGGK